MHAKETTEGGSAAQLHERVPQQEGEAACTSHHSLQTHVFAVREASRYSGLRSLHVVHGDEASAFIIALFPSKALHCRERRSHFARARYTRTSLALATQKLQNWSRDAAYFESNTRFVYPW